MGTLANDTETQPPKPVADRPAREVWRRWTPKLVADGWTPVSDYFLESYRRLGLTTSEAMLVIQILRHKWDEKPPRPSFKTLALRMGITDTAVRGHARELERKGCIRRIKRIGKSNQFDFGPLFDSLERLRDQDATKKAQVEHAKEVLREHYKAAVPS